MLWLMSVAVSGIQDHKTVMLDGWHRVLMNTENQAPGARAVVFSIND